MFPPDSKCNRVVGSSGRSTIRQRGVQCAGAAEGAALVALPTRGVWGHAPPAKFWKMDALRCVFVHF